LFLGSLRTVLVPVVAIPLSLIGAVFLMQVLGFTINLLTLLAIVLSVGLVVDDAIVVVENVERHLSEGQSPVDAALLGARELVGPLIAMTITLAAVYAPIGLQGGLTGSLFREFAFTLAGAVTISGVVALTLSPMMSSKLLTPGMSERGFAGKISKGFKRFTAFYGRVLDKTLDARPAVYGVWIVVSLMAIPMFIMSPKELAPTEDQGVIFGILEAAANSTLDQNSRYAAAVNDAFMSIPETEFTFQVTFPNSGFGGMVIKPWEERETTVFELVPQVQQMLSRIPAIRMFAVTPPALPGGGDFPVEFVLASRLSPRRSFNSPDSFRSRPCRAACSLSRRSLTSRSISPSRKLSSTATRWPIWGWISSRWARTSVPWSAAIMSTASASPGAATRWCPRSAARTA
jgi:multidrug efflux pump